MAIAKSSIERNNFTGGLITETTALTFPENAAQEIDNFEINRDGSIKRRLGMIEESLGKRIDTQRNALTVANYAIQSFKWANVDNDPTKTLGVIQIGDALWFTDLSSDVLSTAMLNKDSNGVAQPLYIDAPLVPRRISGLEPVSFTAVNGVLIVASSEMGNPIYIEYTTGGIGTSREIRGEAITLKVRDLWGVDDGLPIDERPPKLSGNHKYNLKNQGWSGSSTGIPRLFKNWYDGKGTLKELYPKLYNTNGTLKDYDGIPKSTRLNVQLTTLTSLYGNISDGNREVLGRKGFLGYPSNADIRYLGNGVDGDGKPEFDYHPFNVTGISSTPAPKGKYVIDAFSRGVGRNKASAVGGLRSDSERANISVVAAYANRVFYSGVDSNIRSPDVRSPDYTGCLFFTKSINTFEDFEKCYQEADPTSENDFKLVATDGGFLKIAEASQIVKLIVARASLIVIAKNGIWQITGPDGIFSAESYSINQLTNIGCESPDSIVVAEDIVYYWSDGGIYALAADSISGELNAKNISETTIQTFLNGIPAISKNAAKGRFDTVNRKVTWLYNDKDSYDGLSFKNSYNRELVFDTVLQAFYPRSVGDSSEGTFITAYVETENFVTLSNVQSVVVNGEQVQVNGEDVVATIPTKGKNSGVTKYLLLTPSGFNGSYEFSFGSYGGFSFKDWDETDSPAFLTTGSELSGDTQRDKQIPYLTMHFNRTETGFQEVNGELEARSPSSCSVTSRWSFADSRSSGKWGRPFEAYRLGRNFIPQDEGDDFDYGQSVITTKTKIRGKGRAVAFRFETSEGKDCQIIGWGMPVSGGTIV